MQLYNAVSLVAWFPALPLLHRVAVQTPLDSPWCTGEPLDQDIQEDANAWKGLHACHEYCPRCAFPAFTTGRAQTAKAVPVSALRRNRPAAVRDYLNGGSWQLVGEHIEIETGKRNDRPQLAKALETCRRHRAKLVIAKLDRLSRNLAFIAVLRDSGVEFICHTWAVPGSFAAAMSALIGSAKRG